MENCENCKRTQVVLGAICGDIIGAPYEFDPIRSKAFELMGSENTFTDDTVMTLAIAKAIMESGKDYADLSESAIYWMQKLGREYPNRGYGVKFRDWINSNSPKPYNSFGNGAAMRVSPVGAIAKSVDEAIELSRKVTEVTHNHPEGIKGAEVTAVAIHLALNSGDCGKDRIKEYVQEKYGRQKALAEIAQDYSCNLKWSEICQDTVPESMQCFFESTGYEDAIRNCVWLGGDCDTMGAIAGAVAGGYYGVEIATKKPLECLTTELRDIYDEWNDFIK